jgi:hypothetical protein
MAVERMNFWPGIKSGIKSRGMAVERMTFVTQYKL